MVVVTKKRLKLQRKPSGIMFHHFHGGKHKKCQGSISCEELEAIINSIPRQRIVNANEWISKAEGNRFNGDEVCLTFDDSLRCQFDVALPVLEKYKITAFWFLYTSIYEGVEERLEIYRRFRHEFFNDMDEFYEFFFLYLKKTLADNVFKEKMKNFDPSHYLKHCTYLTANDKKFRFVRDEVLSTASYTHFMDEIILLKGGRIRNLAEGLWLTRRQVKYLADHGHEIGMHSHTHPTKLSQLSLLDQKVEFENNIRVLKKLTGQTPRSVSYPNNSFNKDTLDVLRSLDTKVGFRASSDVAENSSLQFARHNHVHLLQQLIACP